MKDYRDMLSSLKDKVVDAAGKATVAVTDMAGKAGETVTNAASRVVSDEMRDKVAGAAHAVGDRAKYASRMTRLTVDCNAELERVKRTYTEIGRLYYENYRDTADAFLADLCQQVTDANARVAELEAQMADPSLYSDAQKSADVQRAYQKAQQALQTLYEQWEAAEAALSQEEA